MTNQPWTGGDVSKNNALPIKPNQPFWYMHHPNTCWEFIQHKERWLFLPTFRRLFEIAGVNGVRMIPRGGSDSQMARVKMMDNGFEILDWDLGYQTRHITKNGGWYYTSIWEEPKVVANRVVWKRFEEDYNDWRESLIEEGVLNPPDLDILGFFVDMQEKRVERNEGKNMTPRIKKLYEADVLKLEMMKKYIEVGGPITLEGKAPKSKKVKRDV
jgi:hypothetical protein